MSQLEAEFADEDDIVFIYVQTVFEGEYYNTFDGGLEDLDTYGLTGWYAFDPEPEGQNQPATMSMFHTRGTPYSIVIDKEGNTDLNAFTPTAYELYEAIQNAR